MARPRVPELVGVLNLIARLVGFAISLVLLGIIIYEAARWGGPKTYWLTYLTVAAALIVDAWDVAAIADRTRRVPRSPPGCLISEDLLVMCLATPSLVLVAINSSNIAEGLINDAPWADADLWTCILTVLVL